VVWEEAAGGRRLRRSPKREADSRRGMLIRIGISLYLQIADYCSGFEAGAVKKSLHFLRTVERGGRLKAYRMKKCCE
jgi:hypothetical protein